MSNASLKQPTNDRVPRKSRRAPTPSSETANRSNHNHVLNELDRAQPASKTQDKTTAVTAATRHGNPTPPDENATGVILSTIRSIVKHLERVSRKRSHGLAENRGIWHC